MPTSREPVLHAETVSHRSSQFCLGRKGDEYTGGVERPGRTMVWSDLTVVWWKVFRTEHFAFVLES